MFSMFGNVNRVFGGIPARTLGESGNICTQYSKKNSNDMETEWCDSNGNSTRIEINMNIYI